MYGNSELTIAATSGLNSDSRLFRQRNLSVCVLPRAIVRHVDGDGGAGETEVCVVDHELWQQDVENAPLNTRAWVFQVSRRGDEDDYERHIR